MSNPEKPSSAAGWARHDHKTAETIVTSSFRGDEPLRAAHDFNFPFWKKKKTILVFCYFFHSWGFKPEKEKKKTTELRAKPKK